jgi:CelD/BcsL family acetyltransferase involved in cellulose biosynthesis
MALLAARENDRRGENDLNISGLFLEQSMLSTETLDTTSTGYEVLTELSAITTIASEWNELLARSDCNLAFSSAQWFIGSCLRDPDVRPYVIVARSGAALVGILALVLSHAGTVATFPDAESDYNDIVTARDDVPVMTGLLSRALGAGAGYRQLVLSRLRDDSNCLRAAEIVIPAGDLCRSYSVETSCPYIRLLPGYDEYLLTRSKSFRTSLRQAHSNAERHNVWVSELQPESFSPDCLAEMFLSLHLNRFAGRSPLASRIAQTFVREVIPSLFDERRLRAFALLEARSIIAINLCMVGADSLCLWNGGFTAAAARWSPGKLLISAGIRKANALNMTEYDFLRGDEDYKSRWANHMREIGQLEFRIGY